MGKNKDCKIYLEPWESDPSHSTWMDDSLLLIPYSLCVVTIIPVLFLASEKIPFDVVIQQPTPFLIIFVVLFLALSYFIKPKLFGTKFITEDSHGETRTISIYGKIINENYQISTYCPQDLDKMILEIASKNKLHLYR